MRRFWIKTVNLILIISIFAGYNHIVRYRQKTEEVNSLEAKLADAKTMVKNAEKSLNQKEETATVIQSKYKDGTYNGSGKGYGGDIIVDVTIKDGSITEINIVSAKKEDKAYFDMASGVIAEIKESQSWDVDTISGATFSSKGIISAVERALEKAENN